MKKFEYSTNKWIANVTSAPAADCVAAHVRRTHERKEDCKEARNEARKEGEGAPVEESEEGGRAPRAEAEETAAIRTEDRYDEARDKTHERFDRHAREHSLVLGANNT